MPTFAELQANKKYNREGREFTVISLHMNSLKAWAQIQWEDGKVDFKPPSWFNAGTNVRN